MDNIRFKVLKFISLFQSSSNIELFTDSACYYFASLLRVRFPYAVLMYDPHRVHFAVKISDSLYDITGLITDPSDYIEWLDYEEEYEEDADEVLRNCKYLEGR